MDKPLRLRALVGLTERLQEITPDNEYVNDLSERVFRGRTVFGDDDPLPMIAINELPIQPDDLVLFPPPQGTARKAPWKLMIQAWAKNDPKNPADAGHILLADILKALGTELAENSRPPNLLGLGLLCLDLKVGCPVVTTAAAVSSMVEVYLPIEIVLAEDMAEPYA